MVSQVASKLLAHAGFQGAQASALAVMTDITVEFFLNLGRTLRGYTDLYNKGMTAEVRQRRWRLHVRWLKEMLLEAQVLIIVRNYFPCTGNLAAHAA